MLHFLVLVLQLPNSEIASYQKQEYPGSTCLIHVSLCHRIANDIAFDIETNCIKNVNTWYSKKGSKVVKCTVSFYKLSGRHIKTRPSRLIDLLRLVFLSCLSLLFCAGLGLINLVSACSIISLDSTSLVTRNGSI